MAVISSSETLFRIYQTTQRHISEGSNLHSAAYYSFQSQSNVIIGQYCNHSITETAHSVAPLPDKNDEISLVMEVQDRMATVRFLWFISAYSVTNTTVGQTWNQPNN